MWLIMGVPGGQGGAIVPHQADVFLSDGSLTHVFDRCFLVS